MKGCLVLEEKSDFKQKKRCRNILKRRIGSEVISTDIIPEMNGQMQGIMIYVLTVENLDSKSA